MAKQSFKIGIRSEIVLWVFKISFRWRVKMSLKLALAGKVVINKWAR